ncbi:hypothetical protein [Pseudomonas chlororaphis]|uniref:hypothetical protein n=1 Tax=Pseudomonas chlororaphis TaxID=587753 RepID=UPI000A76A569|nr:hypothetical protein [Pseudomonas chlororaphis]
MPMFDSLQARPELLSTEAEKTAKVDNTKYAADFPPCKHEGNELANVSKAGSSAPGGGDFWRNNMSTAPDKLKTGKDREMAARLATYATPKAVRGKAETVHPDSILHDNYFSQNAISMDLANPQKIKPSSYVSGVLNKREGGGLLLFTALKVNCGEDAPGFSALQIVENYEGKAPDRDGKTVLGYWAPQGGYVDIPAKPNGGVKYVFTPAFSGCSFCVDQLSEDILRVWHVEGGKEDAQYNNIDKNMHGLGMAGAMEYCDYGYHSDSLGDKIENITGFAFLKIDEKGQWRMQYQGQLAAPNIAGTQNTFLGGKTVDARVSKDLKVSKTHTSEPIHRPTNP